MIIDLNELNKLKDLGLVRSSRHPSLPLTVWKYTQKCQFEKAFGDYPLLRKARGLILDDNGNICARSYEKFFNYSEMQKSELPIGVKDFVIETKLDGSCIIVFRYNDQVIYSTLGSFCSDQAFNSTFLFKQLYNEDWIENGVTYLFELIGPSNKVVNLYEKDNLILHGAICTDTGLDYISDKPFIKVQTHETHGELFGDELYSKLLSLNIPNEEGFVLKVKEDGLPTWMCKIKFEDYCLLHKMITGLSNKSIWEYLRDNKSFDELIEYLPDEFYSWVSDTKNKIINDYNALENRAKLALMEVQDFSSRKEQAIYLMNNHKTIAPIVFKLLDNESYSEMLWNYCKPEFSQPKLNLAFEE